jgi:integrative and conjugative element protein (TIGR02256 family)
MNSLLFGRADAGALAIASDAVATLLEYRQTDGAMNEAGGILLGRMLRGCDDVVIDVATRPHPSDQRTRFSFIRQRQPAQDLVIRAWEESQGTCIYLGEWHSHPQTRPHPSPLDFRNWRTIIRSASISTDVLFFLIVGTGEIAVWEYARGIPANQLARTRSYDSIRRLPRLADRSA